MYDVPTCAAATERDSTITPFTPVKPGLKARVGLFSIGDPHYWVQFAGLLERLLGYGRFIEGRLSEWGEVYNFGMVDSEEKGHQAGDFFQRHNVDILICHTATYTVSAFVLPVVQI